jgi:membrane protein
MMRAADETPGEPGDEHAAHTPETAGNKQPGVKAGDRPGIRRARRAAEWGKNKYAGSGAEYLWHRLDAADFMNQALLLAATLLLCAVPFVLVASALGGRQVVQELTHRLGLSQQASADAGHLFTSTSATSNAVTGLSWAFFILAGIAGATAIQQLYQRVFAVEPGGLADRLRAVLWLALAVGGTVLASEVGPALHAATPVLFWIVILVAQIAVWWFTLWFLLGGRISWRRLYPCAVATGACWTGMLAVFDVILSGMIITYDQKYGAIGVVFAFMSLFIAVGVVLVLGAVVGLVWQDRGMSWAAAVRKLRRAP